MENKNVEKIMSFLKKNIPKKTYYVKDIDGNRIRLKQNELIAYILGQFRNSNYAVVEDSDKQRLIVEKNHEWLTIDYVKKGHDESVLETVLIEKRFI